MNEQDTLLVVGGGTAGSELAIAARQQGWVGPIVVLGAETHLPYHRPPLSKDFLLGKTPAEKLPLRPTAAYEAASVELALGNPVVAIEPDAHRVLLADGTTRGYAKLALCLGGRPRPLPLAEAADNVCMLRDQPDALAIQARLLPGARVVVLGGGYVGLEVAASATKHGAHVTVLEVAPRVLARAVGPELSAFFEAAHREHGVDVRTGVRDVKVQVANGSAHAVTADGDTLPADLVVVGIGMIANTELAVAAGLTVRDAIVVDEHAQTSHVDIYAAGDCTELPGGKLYQRPIRLESVANATEQARAAAAAICGKPRPYHPVPWFWSDQYDLKLQSVGLAEGYDRFVLRGDPAARSFTGFYLRGTTLLAADAINRPGEFMAAKRLISLEKSVDGDRLADDTRPLKELLV